MQDEIPVQSFGSGGVMNRPQIWKAVGLTLLACGLQLYGQQKATIITFDDPAAGTGQYQGTFATTISPDEVIFEPGGVIAGYYLDVNNVYHGFVRARGGSFANFDAPGGGNQPYQGTQAFSINLALAIVGFSTDINGTAHCFLRAPNGTITTIDPPGSLGSVNLFPPSCIAINPAGATTGNYQDGNDTHGFLRSPSGRFTSFDPPNSSFTVPTGITPAGAIAGYYQDGNGTHGFLRTAGGAFISFDPSNSQYTQTMGMNPAGTVTGWYEDNLITGPPHSFLRARNGTITTFDYPNTSLGTFGYAINLAGTITGSYFANNQYHGFLRHPNGTFASFDPPGSTNTTTATAINPAGEITGFYPDNTPNFINHGFLRNP